MKEPLIYCTFAQTKEQLHHTVILTDSIRTFCGDHRDAPIWVYLPGYLLKQNPELTRHLVNMNAELKIAPTPAPSTKNMFYAWKVFAAAHAEKLAEQQAERLVWMDEDTIFINQPDELIIDKDRVLGYRPVMHNRSGVEWESEPNLFWKQIYSILGIDHSMLFPMITPADNVSVNAYFNAGLLVVRPEHSILRRWASCFDRLCNDSMIVKLCINNTENRIFLHQTALVGAVLPYFSQHELVELPDTVNYPLFFDQMYGANKSFEDITDKISIRYDAYFRKPDPAWSNTLVGDPHVIEWLKSRLAQSVRQ